MTRHILELAIQTVKEASSRIWANFSRRGIGYSWGFRGFRLSHDARGRVVRTLTIPGTGLYKRDYLTSGKARPVGKQQTPGKSGLYVALPLVILIILTAAGGLRAAAMGLGVMLVLYFALKVPRASGSQDSAPSELPLIVRPLFAEMQIALKDTLRKARVASQFGTMFEGELLALMVRFAALDGRVTAEEGQVLVDVLGQITRDSIPDCREKTPFPSFWAD